MAFAQMYWKVDEIFYTKKTIVMVCVKIDETVIGSFQVIWLVLVDI